MIDFYLQSRFNPILQPQDKENILQTLCWNLYYLGKRHKESLHSSLETLLRRIRPIYLPTMVKVTILLPTQPITKRKIAIPSMAVFERPTKLWDNLNPKNSCSYMMILIRRWHLNKSSLKSHLDCPKPADLSWSITRKSSRFQATMIRLSSLEWVPHHPRI